MSALLNLFASASTFLERLPLLKSKSQQRLSTLSPLSSSSTSAVVTLKNEETPVSDSRWKQLTTTGDIPCQRSGHSCLFVGHYMYIFGGFDGLNCKGELYRFDTVTYEWEQILTTGLSPVPRASYAWTCSADQSRIYLFGGSGTSIGESNIGSLLEYNVATRHWTQPTVQHGTTPVAGYGQTLSYDKDKLYLFGGTTGHVFSNDLYMYDISTCTWTGPITTTGNIPSVRYKHQMVSYQESLYLVGGGLLDAPEGDIDMYALHLPTLKWTRIEYSTNSISTAKGKDVTNAIPSARIAHTAVLYQDQIILFGGRDAYYNRQNDVYAYAIETNEWRRYNSPCDGTAPSARDFHAAGMSTKGEMFLFGGSDGVHRNQETHRFNLIYTSPSLLVLCLKYVIQNREKFDEKVLQLLPLELQVGLECMNPDVSSADNDTWFTMKPEVLKGFTSASCGAQYH